MTTTTVNQAEKASIAWAALAWIGFLHVGALLAFVPAFFDWYAVLTCVVLHWVTGGLGITLTYHRLLTHRSFEVRPKWFEYVMTAVACSASEGGPIGWVADHRRHHAHSDEEGDVHTPARGFGWAHMLLVDDSRRHLRAHPGLLQALDPRPDQGSGPASG